MQQIQIDLFNRHPTVYNIFHPNPLISSRLGVVEAGEKNPKDVKKVTPLSLIEARVISVLMNYVRNSADDQMFYHVPYSSVFSKGTLTSGKKGEIFRAVRDSLHLRYYELDKKYTKHYLNKDGDATFSPFVTVVAGSNGFEIEIHRIYKRMLKALEHGYTRGDLDTILTLKLQASIILYWEFRQRQSMNKKWQVSLDELKYKLYLQDKYPKWGEFERNILRKVQDEFKDKWVAFNYEPVIENRKVKAIAIEFKKGPMEEKDLPAGYDYKWEKTLLNYGISDFSVCLIRNYVKSGMRHTIGFNWDEQYVLLSIDAFREDLVRKNKGQKTKAVRSPGAYLYQGLINGWWLQYVAEKKLSSQLILDGLSPEDLKIRLNTSENVEPLHESLLKREMENEKEDHTQEWRNVYEDVKGKFASFEDFLATQNYRLESGRVVRKNQ